MLKEFVEIKDTLNVDEIKIEGEGHTVRFINHKPCYHFQLTGKPLVAEIDIPKDCGDLVSDLKRQWAKAQINFYLNYCKELANESI